jgi:large subunit ribosomal protein L22
MVEQKEIDNKKIDEVKSEKPVTEVKDNEDVKKLEDIKQNEAKKDEKKDKDIGTSEKSKDDADNKKDETKKEKSKPATGPKKDEAVVNGRDLRISTKHSVAVCNFIKNKNIDEALAMLDEVSKMKRAIPMRGEIPHRKGKGMMSGRYPLNAVKAFTMLLKSLKANAINHELELEKVKLACMPNSASRPMKRFGQGKHKRTHVQIKLVPLEVRKKK